MFTTFDIEHVFLFYLQDPKDTPPPTRAETRDERRERKRREKAEQVAYKLEQEIAMCKLVELTNRHPHELT